MAQVKRLTYQKRCLRLCELRVFREFLQVFYDNRQVAAFHLDKVRALIGERREDALSGTVARQQTCKRKED